MVTATSARTQPVAVLTAALLAATSAAPAQEPATLALLVGIDRYAPPAGGEGFAALKGAENDVARARQLLVEQFRFDPAGIETLVGPQATHAAIVAKFHEHLIQQAGPKTRVVFWFSGHGARIPDASRRDMAPRRDEERPWDDTLVAYDSRSVAADGSYDLADDELFTLLTQLRAEDVVVVTDCCHSGGVLRGDRVVRDAGSGTRPLDLARIADIWPAGLPEVREDSDGDLDQLPNVLQVAACGATEEAGEVDYDVGCFGTCTYYLSIALRAAGPATTWDEVVAQTYASTIGKGTKTAQRVHLVGDGRRLVMGGRGRDVPPGYDCELFGERTLRVAAGSIHGIGVGARFELFDYDRKLLGEAVVDRVGVSSCNASWKGLGKPERRAMRARPASFGAVEPSFRVALAEGVPRELFAHVPYVAVVAADEADDVAADVTIERVGDKLILRQRDGRRGKEFEAAPGAVVSAMLREHHRRTLWNCAAVPGQLHVGVEVQPATFADLVEDRFLHPCADRLLLESGPNGTVSGLAGVTDYVPGSYCGGLVRVCAHNRSEVALHVAIVSVAENGETWLLYGKDRNNVLGPGQSFTKRVQLVRDAAWSADEPMIDRYLVIATPNYADFRAFVAEHPTLTRGGDDDTNALPPLLRQALGGARTRGDFAGGDDAPMWGIAAVDLCLVTPAMFDRLSPP